MVCMVWLVLVVRQIFAEVKSGPCLELVARKAFFPMSMALIISFVTDGAFLSILRRMNQGSQWGK